MTPLDDPTPRYHVRVDETVYGPYPAGVLSDWIAQGKVTDNTPVQTEGGQWVLAREWIRRLARESAGPPATPPPVPAEFARPPAAASMPTLVAAPPTATNGPGGPGGRDRVVIIGRRQSGKTIYLASVYARLWKSLDGMTAKAVSGTVHQQLMDTHQTLQNGRWPAATLDTFQVDMDVEHNGTPRRLVTLDFAGEMFRKAFVEEQLDFPGVRELVDHIDRAAAVLLLVDPAVVSGTNHEAAMDDDFGLVQAAERIRRSPGGDAVPIALVLTKADQHQNLIDHAGGAPAFVRQHFPALIRLLKQLPVFQVSAVQTERKADGTTRPWPDSQPINVEAPLKFCLDRIDAARLQADAERREFEHEQDQRRAEAAERDSDRRANLVVVLSVAFVLLVGAGVVAWILTRHAN